MKNHLLAALALLAISLSANAGTIAGVQQQTTTAQLNGLAGVQARPRPAADKRIAVPDRIHEIAETAGDSSAYFRYDADGNLIGEVLNPGTPEEQRVTYTVDTLSNPPVIFSEAVNGRITRSYHWEFGNELQAFTDHLPDGSSVTHYAHGDGQGSIRFLTDEAGTVTDTFDYDAAGNVVGRTGTTDLRFLFRGEHMNPRTGWYHLRARWMDPKVGRFASQDPFPGFSSDPRALHKYSYASNDPVNNLDPHGLFTLTELSVASDIRSVLGNIQSDVGFNVIDGIINRDSYNASTAGWSAVLSAVPGAVGSAAGLFRNVKFVANARAGRGWVKALSGTSPKEIRSAEFLADHFAATVFARGQRAGADLYIAGKRWELKVLTTGSPSNAAEKVIDAVKHQKASRVVVDVMGSTLGVAGVEAAYAEVLRKSARDGFTPPAEFLAILPDGSVFTRP